MCFLQKHLDLPTEESFSFTVSKEPVTTAQGKNPSLSPLPLYLMDLAGTKDTKR